MKILLISHRIPFPPNKGEKIRSYNILKYLAQKNDIFLASLIDDIRDTRWLPVLDELVKKHFYEILPSAFKKIECYLALLKGNSISVSYFYSKRLQQKIDLLIDSTPIDAIFCISSQTAEYVFRSRHRNNKLNTINKIMDLIDVDSLKWRQYSESSRIPISMIYHLESRFLKNYEKSIAREFDRLVLVSENEKKYFLQTFSECDIFSVPNGVDLEYFNSIRDISPFNKDNSYIVFVGQMDYRPNIEGVEWFARKIFNRIRLKIPNVSFIIVGSRPIKSVKKLAEKIQGVEVTDFVQDVRPYLSNADVVVIPLKLARGIQNKVLEAMAMAQAVVGTPQAIEGIDVAHEREVLVADTEELFSQAVIRLLEDRRFAKELGIRARRFVEMQCRWEENLQILDMILDNTNIVD